MKNIFETEVIQELEGRMNALNSDSQPEWGKMSVGQMLAHVNVPYDMVMNGENYKKPGAIQKFFLKLIVKNIVVGPKPYKKNSRTPPDFLITDKRDFEEEKRRLTANLDWVKAKGRAYFENKESQSLGRLTAEEWNVMFYKHLDHHLSQFGV